MSRLAHLRDEFAHIRSALEAIEATAAAEGRELSDSEQADSDQLFARATALRPEIEALSERQDSLEQVSRILARVNGAQAVNGQQHRAEVAVPPVEVYCAEWLAASDHRNQHRAQAMAAFVDRYRTVATQITTDNAGVVPVPILGPITSFIDGQRRLVPSFTARPMPASGATFTRPKLTQHVTVGQQVNQLDELSSQKQALSSDTVTKHTYGGALELSQQDLDWTDPAILNIVIQDFIDVYSKATEARAASSLTAAATSTVAWTSTDPGTVVQSVLTGAKTVYTACCTPADTLWLALDAAASIAAMVDTQKHPVFTEFGTGRVAANDITFGLQGFLGLNVVVAPDLANGTKILGARRYAEWYEDRAGFLTIAKPTVLSTQIATYGYVATYFKSEGFVKLV